MTKRTEYVEGKKSYCENCYDKMEQEGRIRVLSSQEIDMQKLKTAVAERWYQCSECGHSFFG